MPSQSVVRRFPQGAVRGLRGATCLIAVATLAVLGMSFEASAAVICDASETPAGSDPGAGAPRETNDTKERDEREAAPRQERNGKGGRRIRGSDPHAEKRVMNA